MEGRNDRNPGWPQHHHQAKTIQLLATGNLDAITDRRQRNGGFEGALVIAQKS